MNRELTTLTWSTKGRVAPWNLHHGGHDGSKIGSNAGAATKEAVSGEEGLSTEVPQGRSALVHL